MIKRILKSSQINKNILFPLRNMNIIHYNFSQQQQQSDKQQNDQNNNEEQKQNDRKQQQEEAREKAAKEALLRKQMKEENEINELRNQFEDSNSKFSTFSQFMKLIKSKLLLAGAGILTLTIGYQIYDITEKHVDPVDGQKKILPIKRKYEILLSNCISGIFLGENKTINQNNKLYAKLKKVQSLFQLYQKMDFPVNGKINILDREDFIFFMLPNGDLFVSKRVAFDLKEQELQILMGYELSHIYMRSSTKNIPISQLTNILLMKLFDFTELFNQFVPLQEIRQYYTLPITEQQENNNLIMAADILDEIGIELDPESLKYYLRDISETFVQNPNPYILDFKKKHPYLY